MYVFRWSCFSFLITMTIFKSARKMHKYADICKTGISHSCPVGCLLLQRHYFEHPVIYLSYYDWNVLYLKTICEVIDFSLLIALFPLLPHTCRDSWGLPPPFTSPIFHSLCLWVFLSKSFPPLQNTSHTATWHRWLGV